MTKPTLLTAIRQLTDLRTELLLYKEAERQKHDSENDPSSLHALEEAENAIRYAALLWLMDIAHRVSSMAQEVLGEVSGTINSRAIANQLVQEFAEPNELATLPQSLSAEELEPLFMQQIEEAMSALNLSTHSTAGQAIPVLCRHLQESALRFKDYLNAPEETIAALIGFVEGDPQSEDSSTPPTVH